ncbi:hypothetical protein [Streptomyces paludis]|uniref:Uncharacterized protein n=1 Tax=Streptomyces paludis TaxID=2282738 RepID=A0A345HT23_9ACTN|nr:hypothetical protein [Streptomyces paludis]AXG79847.1 hypothetical protein DVK44_21785 [Streptomyces paludis]
MGERTTDTGTDDPEERGGAGRSDARERLSLLMETFGADGALVVGWDEPIEEDSYPAPAPGASPDWPACRCGGPKCRPDDWIPEKSGADGPQERDD